METGAPSKSWERPWSTEEMRRSAGSWSLAGDSGLLNHLKDFSQRLTTRTHATTTALDALCRDLDVAAVNVSNATNAFLALSNTQFVESRVYEDEVKVTPSEEVTRVADKVLTKAEQEAEMVARIKESLAIGMACMDTMFNVVEVPGSDSDTDEDSSSSVGRTVLEPKNPYLHRPLPYLIGSKEFLEDDRCGLGELFSDDEGGTPPLTARSSSGELDLPAAPPRGASASLSDESDGEKEGSRPTNRDGYEGDMFGGDMFERQPPVQQAASFADELAAKLGGVASRSPTNRASPPDKMADMFAPEEEDSLFGPGEGKFSGGRGLFDDLEPVTQTERPKVAVVTSQAAEKEPQPLFGDADDIFSHDDDMFKVKQADSSPPQPQATDVGKKKSLHGGVSIFAGDFVPSSSDLLAGKKSLGAATRAEAAPPVAVKTPAVQATQPPSQPAKHSSLFDDEETDDLFSVAPVKPSLANQRPALSLFDEPDSSDIFSSVAKPVTSSLKSPLSLFDDVASPSANKKPTTSLFDESNSSNDKNIPRKVEPSKSRTKGTISLFDDSDDILSTPSSNKKATMSIFDDSKNIPTKVEPPPTDKKAIDSLFDDSDDFLSSSSLNKKATISIFDEPRIIPTDDKPLKSPKKKSTISLFDESDSGDDEMLFSSTSSPSTHSRRSARTPEKPLASPDDFATNTPDRDIFGAARANATRSAVRDDEDIFAVPSVGTGAGLFDFDGGSADDLFAVPSVDDTDDLFASETISSRLFEDLKASEAAKKPEPPRTLNLRRTADLFAGDEADEEDLFGPAPATRKKDVEREAPKIAARPTVVPRGQKPESAPTQTEKDEKSRQVGEVVGLNKNVDKNEIAIKNEIVEKVESEIKVDASKVEEKMVEGKKVEAMMSEARNVVTKPLEAKSVEATKVFGRVKSPLGLVIDPTALLPGARPRKPATSGAETGRVKSPPGLVIDPTALPPGARRGNGAPDAGAESEAPGQGVGFDAPVETTATLHSVAKERARIPVKRRPQSRRARQEAIRTSAIFPDDLDSPSPLAAVPPSRGQNPLSPSTDEEDLFGVPQDLYEDSRSGKLFDGATVLSPAGGQIGGDPLFEKTRAGLFADVDSLFSGGSDGNETTTKSDSLFGVAGSNDATEKRTEGLFDAGGLFADVRKLTTEDVTASLLAEKMIPKNVSDDLFGGKASKGIVDNLFGSVSRILPTDNLLDKKSDGNVRQISAGPKSVGSRSSTVPTDDPFNKKASGNKPLPTDGKDFPGSVDLFGTGSSNLPTDDLFNKKAPGGKPLPTDGLFNKKAPGNKPLPTDGKDSPGSVDLFGSGSSNLPTDDLFNKKAPGGKPLPTDGLFNKKAPGNKPLPTDGKDSPGSVDLFGSGSSNLPTDDLFNKKAPGGKPLPTDGLFNKKAPGNKPLPTDGKDSPGSVDLFGSGSSNLPTDDLFNKKAPGGEPLPTDGLFNKKASGGKPLPTDGKDSPGSVDLFGSGSSNLPTDDLFNKKASGNKPLPTDKKDIPANTADLFGTGSSNLPTDDLFDKKAPGNKPLPTDGKDSPGSVDLFGTGSSNLPTDDLFNKKAPGGEPLPTDGLFNKKSPGGKPLPTDGKDSPGSVDLFGTGSSNLPTDGLFNKKAPGGKRVPTDKKDLFGIRDSGSPTDDLFSGTKKSAASKSSTGDPFAAVAMETSSDAEDSLFGAPVAARKVSASSLKSTSIFEDEPEPTGIFSTSKMAARTSARADKSLFDDVNDDDDMFGASSGARQPARPSGSARREPSKKTTRNVAKATVNKTEQIFDDPLTALQESS